MPNQGHFKKLAQIANPQSLPAMGDSYHACENFADLPLTVDGYE